MAEEATKDPIDAYDAAHGVPGAAPAEPQLSEADKWGTSLNPLRETPLAGANLKDAGK